MASARSTRAIWFVHAAGFLLLWLTTQCSHAEVAGSESCAALVSKTESCWLEVPTVPSCKGREDLENCAKNKLLRAKSCDEDTRQKLQQMVDVYSTLTSILCQHSELHKEFEKQQPCWVMARNCALRLTTFSSASVNHSLCREAYRGMVVCGYYNFMCQELQEQFTSAVYRASACGQYDPEVVDELPACPVAYGGGGGATGNALAVTFVSMATTILAVHHHHCV